MSTEELVRALRAPDQRGMGQIEGTELGVPNIEGLTRLDTNARAVRVWDPTVIPGNLQTPAYSAYVISSVDPQLPGFAVRRRVVSKQERARQFHDRLADGRLKSAIFIIGERAITQPLMDDDMTHKLQLRHLLILSQSDRISLHVLADSADLPTRIGGFALYTMWDQAMVGYCETVMGAWYSTRLEHASKMHSAFNDLTVRAMSRERTADFIRGVLESWRTPKRESPALTEGSPSSSPRTLRAGTTVSESPTQLGSREQ